MSNQLIDQLVANIFLTTKVIHRQMSVSSKKSYPLIYYILLRFIEEKKPLMIDIANFLSIKPPSVTFLINKLIKFKLVTRDCLADDRRKTRILLTAKGKKTIEGEIKKSVGKLKGIFSCLSQKEQQELIKILTKIRAYEKNNQ